MSSDNYWPQDTDTKMYLQGDRECTLQDLLEVIKEKWPKADIGHIQIDVKNINVYSNGYGRYDPTDYELFFVITYEPK